MRDTGVIGAEGGKASAGSLAEGYAVRLYPLDDRDEVGLADLWRTLWAKRWLVGSIALAAGILAALLTFLITPVYRASVLAAPTAEAVSGGLAHLAAQLPGMAASAGFNLSGDTRTAGGRCPRCGRVLSPNLSSARKGSCRFCLRTAGMSRPAAG